MRSRPTKLGLEELNISPLIGGAPTPSAPSVKDPSGRSLLDLLADGPLPVPEIRDRARQAGYQWWPVKKRRQTLPIVSEEMITRKGRQWRWRLK